MRVSQRAVTLPVSSRLEGALAFAVVHRGLAASYQRRVRCGSVLLAASRKSASLPTETPFCADALPRFGAAHCTAQNKRAQSLLGRYC